MAYQGGGQLGNTDCCAEVEKRSPMEQAIRRVDEQLKMLGDELDKLHGKLQGISSIRPCSPTVECPKQPQVYAPIIEITNTFADKISCVRDRVKTIREALDI